MESQMVYNRKRGCWEARGCDDGDAQEKDEGRQLELDMPIARSDRGEER